MEPQLSLMAESEGTTLTVSVAGELDRSVSGRVEEALEEGLSPTTEHIVLDLQDVSFLDLAAVRTLLVMNARSRDQGCELTVLRPSGTASRIFTLTRIGEVLDVRGGQAR